MVWSPVRKAIIHKSQIIIICGPYTMSQAMQLFIICKIPWVLLKIFLKMKKSNKEVSNYRSTV